MGKDGRERRPRSSHSDSDFKDFKNFHVPKVFKGFFLVLGLILGVALTAFVKNTLTDYYNNSVADNEVSDGSIPREPPPRTRPRTERPKAQAPRLAPPQEIASAPVEAPRVASRKVSPPAPKVQERAGQSQSQSQPMATPVAVASEPKPLPKLVAVAGLSYGRETFVTCSEDCVMTLHSRSGQSMKVKLKKSQFLNSLDRDNSRIDIEGYVTEDRLVRIESVKAYARREPGSQSAPTEMFPDESEAQVKVRKPVHEEFDNIRDTATAEVEQKPKAGRVQAQSLKSRLEASTGNSPKAAPSDDNGGSFQDRLKRSTR